jgi:putative endonuclease
MTKERRQRAQRLGRWAEFLCASLLRLKGYRILARDWRSPVGEIDIVACRGHTLVFVEVKSRSAQDIYPLGPIQRQRIIRAAIVFVQSRPKLVGFDIRFDLMQVAPWRRPQHLIDAWRTDE